MKPIQFKTEKIYITDQINLYLWIVRIISFCMVLNASIELFSGKGVILDASLVTILFHSLVLLLGVFGLWYSTILQTNRSVIPTSELIGIQQPWYEFGRSVLKLSNGKSRVITQQLTKEEKNKLNHFLNYK